MLISSPRPTPDLSLTQKCYRSERRFHRSLYKTNWLVGCSHTNKLYCWSCILFSNVKTVWNNSGFNDLRNLSNLVKKHSNSLKHLKAAMSFSTFGKQLRQTPISEEILKHNRHVDINHSVFQRLVDVVCHLANQELPFKGHDESKISLNKGNFLELVGLLSKYDFVLDKHMQYQESDKSGPSYLSNETQNDIIHSVADVIKTRIESEVKMTELVSIIIDETQGPHREQLYLILRYYYENNIHDRFLGFIDVSESRSADFVSNKILELLKKYNCTTKVVLQSYDGASIISAVRNGVQQKLKEVCPEVMNIWCNAYILTLELSKSCDGIGEVWSFFSALQALCNYISHKNMPHSSASRWTHTSEVVKTIFDQKRNLVEFFSNMYDNPQDWDGDAILAAENFCNTLQSFNFNFYLSVFHLVFQRTDCLYNIVQKPLIDVEYFTTKIKEFQSWLRHEFRKDFDQIYEDTLLNTSAPRLRRNIRCARKEYKRLFGQIIDKIYTEIDDKYSEIFKLQFFKLYNNKLFNSIQFK